MGEKYIAWLSDIYKEDSRTAGNKGANLGEIFNAKFPVPQGFIITTTAFQHLIKETKLNQPIKDILNKIDVDNTNDLIAKSKEIQDLIINAEMPEDLQKEILEAYDNLNIDLTEMKDSPGALAILKSAREPIFVSVRSSATTEDLDNSSFAGQQESFTNVKGNPELIQKVKQCFASIFTTRAIYYRKKKGFEGSIETAVVIQKMINSDKAGTIFSQHPLKDNNEILIEAAFGQGEGITSGKIKPDQYILTPELEIIGGDVSNKKVAVVRTAGGQTKTIQLTPEKSQERVLKVYEIKQLADYAMKIQEHYEKPQNIEFAIENEDIYILQTRPITAKKTASPDEKEAELAGQIIAEGTPASPGIASGTVKIVHAIEELEKIKEGDILVTATTNPNIVIAMQKAVAIISSEGGVTSHASIISREMGIPAIVGVQNALDILKDGDEITIDGSHGKIFSGKAQNKSIEILPIAKTKTKIKVIVDLPQFAEHAAKTESDGIGLIRIEGLIAAADKHPLAYRNQNKLEEYQTMLKTGLEKIIEPFRDKPVWIRTSDIRNDEHRNLEGTPEVLERNPLLGNHGIRFSLKNPNIFKSELSAIKELADRGHKVGVLLPQVTSIEEIKQTKEIFNELGINNVKLGIVLETPAAAILIKDICEEGIDFISFDTRNLTQYTLAIDQNNEENQDIYDETNWATLKQISRVIRECKKQNVETSIYTQAPKPEMIKFLVKQGIDSITLNADATKKVSDLILELEKPDETQKENVSN